jgi:magnesium transporter
MVDTIKYGNITWTNITKPNEADFKALTDFYHFHPLDIEDCRSLKNLRPKLDDYSDYVFINLHLPTLDKNKKLIEIKELKIFWTEKSIITLSRTIWEINNIFNTEKKDNKFIVGSTDILLYNILDKLTKYAQIVIDKIELDVEDCGNSIFDRKPERVIQKISLTRKNIITLNTMFKPQLILYNKLVNEKVEGFADNMEDYWGNILDYYQKMWDIIEDSGELIKGYGTTFDSLQMNRTNEVMKILTLISSILLPVTFVASLYGMNIDLPFQHNARSFLIVFGGMLVIVALMISYFRYKEWM